MYSIEIRQSCTLQTGAPNISRWILEILRRASLLIDGPHNSQQGLLFLCCRLRHKTFPFPASCGRMERENPYDQFLGKRRRGIPGVCSGQTSPHLTFTVTHPSTLSPLCPWHKVYSFSENRQLLFCQCRGIWGIIFSQAWRSGDAKIQTALYTVFQLIFSVLAHPISLLPPELNLSKALGQIASLLLSSPAGTRIVTLPKKISYHIFCFLSFRYLLKLFCYSISSFVLFSLGVNNNFYFLRCHLCILLPTAHSECNSVSHRLLIIVFSFHDMFSFHRNSIFMHPIQISKACTKCLWFLLFTGDL